MKSIIQITFDLPSLSARIKRLNVENRIWSQVYLSCSSFEDFVMESEDTFLLPWFEFRLILKDIAKYLKSEQVSFVYDDYAKKLVYNHTQDFISFKNARDNQSKCDIDISETLLSAGFKRKLTPEQSRDVKKLLCLRHGANFSVPGAGKTTSLLAIHSILKMENKVSNLLVVAPRNAFISWEDELVTCFNNYSIEVKRLTGGKSKIASILVENPEICLITYHQLPNVVDEVTSYLKRNNVHLVLDESHRIKRGISGVHYLAVAKLADFASRRDILTGTPLPQSTGDLQAQFDFLWPGSQIFSGDLNDSDEFSRIKFINQKLKPLYTRTTKGELGLTPPIIKVTKIELGPVQSELYELIRSESFRELKCLDKEDSKSFRKLGKSVMRLLQIASNPMLIASDNFYEEDMIPIPVGSRKWELLMEFAKYEKAAKIEYTLNRVKQLVEQGNKVVVWSSFIQNIELLETKLSNYGAVSIHGGVETGDEEDANTREGRIRRFHDDSSCWVLIANPAACGEGISLHKVCHYALYVDRTFNAAHYLQSVDRIHRLGLAKNIITQVEVLQAENTIDCVAEDRLVEKIRIMSEVLEDKDLYALAYDPEDIIENIPGGIEIGDVNAIVSHLEE